MVPWLGKSLLAGAEEEGLPSQLHLREPESFTCPRAAPRALHRWGGVGQVLPRLEHTELKALSAAAPCSRMGTALPGVKLLVPAGSSRVLWWMCCALGLSTGPKPFSAETLPALLLAQSRLRSLFPLVLNREPKSPGKHYALRHWLQAVKPPSF